MNDHRETKENEEDDACSQRRLIAVRSIHAIYNRMAARGEPLFVFKLLIGRHIKDELGGSQGMRGLVGRVPMEWKRS